ncbi:hypothetical protein Tco_0266267 [Tanacetum coccineum]
MKKKSTDFVTPIKASGEAQEEEISPTFLEAAKTLRRARSVAKNINIGLDAKEEINTGIKDVNTGSTKVDSGTTSKKGQREGKAPMIEEDIQATHKTKEQMRQEEARLEEAIELTTKEKKSSKLTKDVLGKDLPEQDFAKRMAEMLKKLKFEEIKEEFDKLVQQIDTFVPINLEATKAKLKRYGEELQTKTSKKQMFDDKDVPAIGDKVVETDKEESVEAMNPTSLTTKSDSVVNLKISQQGQRSIYQIMRANEADTVYMSFGAMVKDFIREDLLELYRLVMQKYGTNRPEDAYDRVLWSDLRTMFDPPLNEDAIWSLPLQQKMVS